MNLPPSLYSLDHDDFGTLLEILKEKDYLTVGPTRRDGAIVYDLVNSVRDLPVGWTDEQAAGSYRLRPREDSALFGYNVGPHSWKKYLFPSKTKLWSATRKGSGFDMDGATDAPPKYAFIGVRACELHAIRIQDRVFTGGTCQDPVYAGRRQDCLIIAVNCTQAASSCFCTSMRTGPKVADGYDIVLTEVVNQAHHYFVIEAGSDRGTAILKELPVSPAKQNDLDAAAACVENAEKQMGHGVDMTGIKDILYQNYDNSRWAELEKKCLACGNCTMVCPTCFCSKVEDITDLTGEHAERWRSWDSCFTMDFSYIHGGHIRPSIGSRYRQWLMHKLATWLDQFGTSGCVGCGRCIAWCPVGIDITREVKAVCGSSREV